jgi:dTDP-4-amino-4,6-dideoxygalactose transaminase
LQETFCVDPLSVKSFIDENYYGKDGKLIHNKEGSELTAIMVVHQFGLCADMPSISALAKEHGLKVIEDSACALGAKIGSKHQGTFGNPSCLSFHPRKSITTGEGGMILTDDMDLAERLRGLRSHGATISAHARHVNKNSFTLPPFDSIGYNYRMTDIQAAMGIAQMEKFDFILDTRRKRAARYNDLLADFDWLIRPVEPDGYYHTYQSYVCMLRLDGITITEGGSKRDRLIVALAEKGIATRMGAHASHMLECYQNVYRLDAQDVPVSYDCDRLSLTLPLYVQMTDMEQDYVVEQLKEIYKCL